SYTRLTVTSSYSLLRTPPPPRPTLFPYTTLFRSETHARGGLRPGHQGPRLRRPRHRHLQAVGGGDPGHAQGAHQRGDEPPRRAEDRKSTRLNSSHVAISYAVFCLKKKTNTKTSCP